MHSPNLVKYFCILNYLYNRKSWDIFISILNLSKIKEIKVWEINTWFCDLCLSVSSTSWGPCGTPSKHVILHWQLPLAEQGAQYFSIHEFYTQKGWYIFINNIDVFDSFTFKRQHVVGLINGNHLFSQLQIILQ